MAYNKMWNPIRQDAEPWDPPAVPSIVVAPHPDDEALITGGLIARQIERGVDVTVVAVTDGEAAPLPIDSASLADIRMSEQAAALSVLGVVRSVRFGAADGRVDADVGALADFLSELIEPGSLVVSPAPFDHHCDHIATADSAMQAAVRSGARWAGGVFWGWQHPPPQAVQLRAMTLSEGEATTKRHAFAQHYSQYEPSEGSPVVSSEDLRPLDWRSEFYVVRESASLKTTAQ